MAGSATVTTLDVGGGVTRYTVAWTSDASGNVSGNSFAVKAGVITQLKFVPASAGSQPTNLYSVTLVDTASIDVIGGAGANLSNSAGVIKNALLGDVYFHDGTANLDLVVANAGNAKGGTVTFWVR